MQNCQENYTFATPYKNHGLFYVIFIIKQLNAEDQELKAADTAEATAITNEPGQANENESQPTSENEMAIAETKETAQ